MNPLKELERYGQSVWLDFITRRFISEGKLKRLIEQDGLKGVTSNPTIFQKAITGGQEYDETIHRLESQGMAAPDIFDALAIEDIQSACDALRSVYDAAQGRDGFVSLEVNPKLAQDTQATLRQVRQLFSRVSRPNVMIKIPGTREGLPAIEQALGEGININITLIFSLQRYSEVINAWLAGLERLAQTGKALNKVASVASFFVSRVDTLVDKQLEKKGTSAAPLLGKAAIANARMAYDQYLKVRHGARFKALEAKGAQPQRPLWASTSTKNPQYRDVMYAEELIGRETVDTLPLQTIDAFRDHGRATETLPGNAQEAAAVLKALAQAGIDMDAVTRQLEDEGVRLFSESYNNLIRALEEKKEAIKAS